MLQKLSTICLLAVMAIACSQSPKADLVIQHADVYTVDSARSKAQSVAVKDGRIVFVGSDADVAAWIGSNTEVLDAKGAFLMPGFIEGHGHIHNLGDFLRDINLMHVSGYDEIVAKVAAAAAKAKPGEWIVGRGWHQEKWTNKPTEQYLGYPYHDALSKVSPNNPVILTHASGHSLYVNAKALALAGITSATPNPTGGDIVKDPSGRLVGVLEETAMGLVRKVYGDYVNQQTEAERKAKWWAGMELAEADCLKKGITSFVDAGSSFEQIRWMKEMAQQNKLQLRHWMMIRDGNASLRANADVFPIINEGNGHLTMNAIKVSLDGALGSYGAWLLESYSDRKNFTGQNTFNMDSLKAIADFAWQKNIQLCVHAIGDKANRETVNIFAEQIQKDKSKDHRWRVEHAQHVHPSEIGRFKEWNIIASMQGIHCTSDAPFVPKRLGEERSRTGAYMWKAFMQAGVLVNNGTDVPVEDADPIPNFFASVTRQLKDGSTFYPEQKMSREEAIYSYTMANAKAQFEEKDKGSIEVGKYADFVLLSNNLLSCSDSAILQTKVLKTIVGGKVLFGK
ncbi:amidohydrolase [Phnomibacter ginsenosidimutans]|uniref:Amidohydrolase family protein n=1 Tax=Phnomibacter ginsenosidimutans TaxID=2676868 RepID=A0A6I6GDX5_9BACT|nr:amidohydrolase [Phnomibacter ginsenosidimutans]QGW28540.1 amidohydrolase family protein [Phnomibacter ginsenosidimutans]